MKKLLFIPQALIFCLFLIKVAVLGEVIQQSGLAATAPPLAKSLQARTPVDAVLPDPKGATAGDSLAKPRDLLMSLEVKKNELDMKEQSLKSEEQRLLSLKKEILEKIDILRVQEEKLRTAFEASKTAEGKKLKDLAKVFESTPPAKAGVMLEQLDVQTAAGITMNMKSDKAGVIWGYLSPQKAVEITREITRLGGKRVGK